VDEELLEFTRRLVRLQGDHPVFRRRGWFKGRPVRGVGVGDIAWFSPDGAEMSDEDWQQPHAKAFAVLLNGDALREVDDEGRPIRDDSFLLLFNAHHEPLIFTMPAETFGARWQVEVDTAGNHESASVAASATLELAGRSVVVVSRPRS
jgi:glycogen operon protein